MNVNWKGVYPALTTKFSEKNEIDIPAFLFNIKKQVDIDSMIGKTIIN